MLESRRLNKCGISVVSVSVKNSQASLGFIFIQSQRHGELACLPC